MAPSSVTSAVDAKPVNNPTSTPYIRLPRELREGIYDIVLANARTLILGLPSPHAGQDNKPRMDDESAENDGSMIADKSQQASTHVDIRLQQQITPLSLLGVSRGTRKEFLAAMARYARKQLDICYFRLNNAALSYRMGDMPAAGPVGPIKSLLSDMTISWSDIPPVVIESLSTLLKWQTDQRMLVRDMEFLIPGPGCYSRVPQVRWTCRTPKHGNATDAPRFCLWFFEQDHFDEYQLTIIAPGNATRSITLYHEIPDATENRPSDMFLTEVGNLGNGMVLNAEISRRHQILNKYPNEGTRIPMTPADILSLKVKEAFGQLNDQDVVDIAELEPGGDGRYRSFWVYQARSYDWSIMKRSRQRRIKAQEAVWLSVSKA